MAGFGTREADNLVTSIDYKVRRTERLQRATRALLNNILGHGLPQCTRYERRAHSISGRGGRKGRGHYVPPLQDAMLLVDYGEEVRLTRGAF